MSCFVCTKETVDLVTVAICRMYCSERLSDVPGSNMDYLDRYKDSDDSNKLDKHKVYSAVYIANLKAYNGRYDDNEKEYPKYTRISAGIDTDGKNTMNALRKYLYQIEEHPIFGTPFYWMVYNVLKEVAYLVATGSYGNYITGQRSF